MNQDEELREQISKIDGLARELFEQQFIRVGGRKDGDPTWADLEQPERDEYWDRALDAAPLLAERDEQITLLKWLHAEASWWLQLDRDEHKSAEVLHNWATRVAYLEARVGYLKNTIAELRAEVERLRRDE